MTTMTLQAARNGLVPAQQAPAAPAVVPGFTSGEGFSLLQRMASMLNQSSLVPQQFQGPANLGNTAIALELASRIGASPLMTMQHLYIVHGRPAWSASFMIACFNQSGRFSSLRYTFVGQEGTDSYGCYASATEKSTGEKLDGTTITLGMAKREGWTSKQGSKWSSMPGQMLMYRAASWFIRAYAPELTMGLRTADEEREMSGTEPDAPILQAAVERPENADIAQIAQKGPSEPRSGGTPCPPTQKTRTPLRTKARAVSGEIQKPSSPAPLETPPAPKPEPAPPATAASPMDDIEQRFIAMCEKADIAHGEILETYERGTPAPFDPDYAIRELVRNPDVFNIVLEDTRERLAKRR